MFRKLGMFDRSLGMFQPPGSIPFQPGQLFANGEQGAWYDPSDFSTMFQDSAGTTPVTAIEQPVGLLLDKSKNLAIGPELCLSGDGTSTTGWAQFYASGTGSFVASGGVFTLTNANPSTYATSGYAITTVIGQTYKVTATLTSSSGATNFFRKTDALSGTGNVVSFYSASGVISTPVLVTGYFVATETTTYILAQCNGNGASISFDNVSVKSLAGNHASQSTTTSRPILRSRYNLLTYTEDFSNAVWNKANVSSSGTSLILEKTTNSYHATYYVFTGFSTTPQYKIAAKVKKYSRRYAYIGLIYSESAGAVAQFDLDAPTAAVYTKAIGAGYSITNATITDSGNGWYILSAIVTAGHPTIFPEVGMAPVQWTTGVENTPDNRYVGSATEGLYVEWMDFRFANDGVGLPVYQRVGVATDYNTVGFPPYLYFDGTDDWLQTANVDFSATDAMSVFAGVRKLSDASAGVISELSLNVASQNGSFLLDAPDITAQQDYGLYARGTVTSEAQANGFPAPDQAVITMLVNIAAATNKIIARRNATQVGVSGASSLGTGNFGAAYPLYIGRRGGATLSLLGRIYSLIIRGALTSGTQLTNTEAWVNSKTGAY